MSSKDVDIEVDLFYPGKSNPKLDARLDAISEILGGHLVESFEDPDEVVRHYLFTTEEDAKDFSELSNALIERNTFKTITPKDDLAEHLYWGEDEASYHHVAFLKEEEAKRFAALILAAFKCYAPHCGMHIFILEDGDEYVVIWALPHESIISFAGEEEEDDEISGYWDIGKKKKEELN